jgi:hypothetical protein
MPVPVKPPRFGLPPAAETGNAKPFPAFSTDFTVQKR